MHNEIILIHEFPRRAFFMTTLFLECYNANEVRSAAMCFETIQRQIRSKTFLKAL